MTTLKKIKKSIRTGFGFGITSGVITTLGLMIGLHSSTGSKIAVLGGILTIAVADAFSDALGIHISEESKGTHSGKEIWIATASTFLAKFFFALTFVFPAALFSLDLAIIISIVLGGFYLTIFSFYLAKKQRKNPVNVILEHLIVAIMVIIISFYIGRLIDRLFG